MKRKKKSEVVKMAELDSQEAILRDRLNKTDKQISELHAAKDTLEAEISLLSKERNEEKNSLGEEQGRAALVGVAAYGPDAVVQRSHARSEYEMVRQRAQQEVYNSNLVVTSDSRCPR